MKLIALILALTCVPSFALAQTGPLVAEPLTINIVPPPWPKDVSEPYDDIQMPGSLCLYPDLQQAMLTQLLWAKKFPELGAKIAEAQAKRDTDVANAYIATQQVAHDLELTAVRNSRPSWPRAILYIGGALVFGAAAGYAAGKVIP